MANIPGTLGFHPQNSLVLFVFERDYTSFGPCYTLGPVLRSEIDSIYLGPDFLTYVESLEPDLLLAVAIGPKSAIAAGKEFALRCEEAELPLAAVWHVKELLTGAPYERIAGESADSLGPWTSGKRDWDGGTVGEILSAPAMSSFTARGELPALDRNEALGFFDRPTCAESLADRRQLTKSVTAVAESFVCALGVSPAAEVTLMVDSLLDDFQDILDTIIQQNLGVDAVAIRDDLVEQAAVYFAHSKLRDALLHWSVSEYAEAFFTVCVSVARATQGVVRANALCCGALAAAYDGQQHRVGQAVQLALEEDCQHRLTLLVYEALRYGGLHVLFEACEEGAILSQKALRGC